MRISGNSPKPSGTSPQGVAYCDEHDITTYARCLRSDRITALERTGRWTDAEALSLELLSRARTPPRSTGSTRSTCSA